MTNQHSSHTLFMDKKNSDNEDPNSCCEKLYVAIRNTSPFTRTIRFTKQQHYLRAAAKPTTATPSANVSLMTPSTPLRDRCVRVTRVDGATIETSPNVSSKPTNFNDRCPRIFKKPVAPAAATDSKKADQKVAVTRDRGVSSPLNNQGKFKATVVPIQGQENRIPAIIPYVGGPKKSHIAESINDMSSEYIKRAGDMIRRPTNVGVQKPGISLDSFNDRINSFINRTKNKFHNSSSFIDASESKEKRLK